MRRPFLGAVCLWRIAPIPDVLPHFFANFDFLNRHSVVCMLTITSPSLSLPHAHRRCRPSRPSSKCASLRLCVYATRSVLHILSPWNLLLPFISTHLVAHFWVFPVECRQPFSVSQACQPCQQVLVICAIFTLSDLSIHFRGAVPRIGIPSSSSRSRASASFRACSHFEVRLITPLRLLLAVGLFRFSFGTLLSGRFICLFLRNPALLGFYHIIGHPIRHLSYS